MCFLFTMEITLVMSIINVSHFWLNDLIHYLSLFLFLLWQVDLNYAFAPRIKHSIEIESDTNSDSVISPFSILLEEW